MATKSKSIIVAIYMFVFGAGITYMQINSFKSDELIISNIMLTILGGIFSGVIGFSIANMFARARENIRLEVNQDSTQNE